MFLDRFLPLMGGIAIVLFALLMFKFPVLGLLRLIIPFIILVIGGYVLFAAIKKN